MTCTPTGLDRRTVLKGTAATAGTAAVATSVSVAEAADNRYFRHGVASGDPLPHAVVIWTRVTPTEASEVGSGVGPRATVTWQVATDRRFRNVVREGVFVTGPSRDHTVKLDVTGLQPAHRYHYRFRYKGVSSRVGSMRTAPAPDSLARNLRLGVVSCANWQGGYFSAYRHLADRDDLHAVLHLGDYLYEYGIDGYGYGFEDEIIREHDPKHEMLSLSDYRRRHAQYKQDPDLQRLHAKYAFIVTWDDHEVTNDQWSEGAENHQESEGDYLARRARENRAFDEWMPVRIDGTAALGDGARLYRRLRFGRLAELSMLDLRSYRSEQVAKTVDSPVGPTVDPALSDPERTITGEQQMAWLKDSLSSNRAQWKLIGNPVMIAPVTYATLPNEVVGNITAVTGERVEEATYNNDQWDGYTADRHEVLDHLRDQGITDTVFLTGDIHSGWACDLPHDAGTYPVSGSVGVEMVCTSVTSNNLKDESGSPPRTTSIAVEEAIKAANRHVKYLNFDDHGFSVLDVTPARVQMDWFIIGDRKDEKATVSWTASWQTVAGTQRVVPVDGPVGS